MVRMVTQLL